MANRFSIYLVYLHNRCRFNMYMVVAIIASYLQVLFTIYVNSLITLSSSYSKSANRALVDRIDFYKQVCTKSTETSTRLAPVSKDPKIFYVSSVV
jgi:hypothetical protein